MECKGELQHGAALLLSVQRLAELIRFMTVGNRTAKACRWHAVPCILHQGKSRPQRPPLMSPILQEGP